MNRVSALSTDVWEGRLIGIVAATLAVFGVAAVYGASSIWAVQRGLPGEWFAVRQLAGLVVGVVALLVCARVDYQFWRRAAWPLLGISAALLIVPLLPFTRSVAPELNGARRWIIAGPITFQPSEIAKFAVVAWVAMLATKKGEAVRRFRTGVLPFILIVALIGWLVFLEPNLSTAVEIAVLAGVVLFAAGARIGHFLLLGMVAVPIVWHEIVTVQYRLTRMLTFLGSGSDLEEASWQINQSLIGIGSGRLIGVGFGEGMQKLGYLPYAYSDFIYSTIGEEWGWIGSVVIIGLFALFVMLGLRVARTQSEPFGRLLAVGITSLIGVSAVLHLGVSLALVPTTGVSLPFVSYGRSGLLVGLAATGILISIANQRGAEDARRGPRARGGSPLT
jgi:cell division protein FtsW